MRLFLSSYRLGNSPEELRALLPMKTPRATVVMNATDYHDQAGIEERYAQEKIDLESIGCTVTRLDLRDYFGVKTEELKKILNETDLLWVRGGNVFLLLRAMKQSGLGTMLIGLLKQDKLAYGGYSAGYCVLSPSMHGVELCDDPYIVMPGYAPEIIWEGLDLVPYSIAPHYKSNHPETAMIDDVVAYFEKHKMPYRTLRDGQAIVINGDSERLVG